MIRVLAAGLLAACVAAASAANGPMIREILGTSRPVASPSHKPIQEKEDAAWLCRARALRQFRELGGDQATGLCSGVAAVADADVPLSCYLESAGLPLAAQGRALLCSGARTPGGPVVCYDALRADPKLTPLARVKRCAGL